MSKIKESKVAMTRRKPAQDEDVLSDAERSPDVPDDRKDPSTWTDVSSGPEEDVKKMNSNQRPKAAGKAARTSGPQEEDEQGEEEAAPTEAQYQVVSYKKAAKKMVQPHVDLQLFGRFCDESLYTKKGIVFNILNNQCHGTSQYVRALRINLDDPTQLNRYLEANLSFLKTTATLLVHDYFLLSRVNLGTSPDLTVDEYSPSFTFASLSEEGKSILPNGEQEGPLWYSMYPRLLKKVKLRLLPDGSYDEAYVVNFRLHQVNANIRIRQQGIARPQPGKILRKTGQYITMVDPASKKSGNFLGPRTGATIPPPPLKIAKPYGKPRSREVDEALSLAQEAQEISRDALHYSQEARRELASLKTDKVYPDLPETPAPRWPTNDVIPPLPDGYWGTPSQKNWPKPPIDLWLKPFASALKISGPGKGAPVTMALA